ncbi:MAG: flagellar basal body rod protein FlgB [Gammaproteobacteria bacterium]|jgi:flagellar basal-body rod protein FlgB|nr:flagellar basal body rod protein FlgB [Gammaproteobacteria bacterium]
MKLDDAFGIHEQAVRLRTQRAEILAGNLANADTPGFKARDVDFAALLRQEMPGDVGLATTRPGHVGGTSQGVATSALLYRNPTQASLDGNTVDVVREQVEFSSNAMQYQASLRFLEGKLRSLLTAIKGD